MRLNTLEARRAKAPRTAEGAPARCISPLQQLERLALTSMLWEDGFYLDGMSVADRITELVNQLPAEEVSRVAIQARTEQNLRHVPLLLASALAVKGGRIVADTIAEVVRRPDEMGELISIFWRNGRVTVTKQMRLGLSRALERFDEYQLAKYDRDADILLRDVLRIVHPRPSNPDRAALYGRVRDRTLAPADTWERALSTGANKKETFERLLRENRLGYLALLRNLRLMAENGVDEGLVREAILARRGAGNVLPFRYTAAARACPRFEPWLDQALCEAVLEMSVLDGRTIVMVDVSGSMTEALSRRSDLTRMDAAATLGAIVPAADLRVFTFSDRTVEVPPRRGMAGVDAIIRSQPHRGTHLGEAMREINLLPHDRLIVITDEQSRSPVPDPVAPRAYMINVAAERNGVGYGRWTHIDGFSERVLSFISRMEADDA